MELLNTAMKNHLEEASVFVEESMTNKKAEVERSVTSVEKPMSTKIEDLITNIKEQIKNEVEQS